MNRAQSAPPAPPPLPLEVCLLALVVWREARGEPYDGKLAVACVVRERMKRPGYVDAKGYTCGDGTLLSTLFSPWQFSSMTDPHDLQLTRWPRDGGVWEECKRAAAAAWNGWPGPIPGIEADSYHDVSIQEPERWKTEKVQVGRIGRLVFYRTK